MLSLLRNRLLQARVTLASNRHLPSSSNKLTSMPARPFSTSQQPTESLVNTSAWRRFSEKEKKLAASIDEEDQSLELAYYKGLAYVDEGDEGYGAALNAFERAIADPVFGPRAYLQMGKIFEKFNNKDQAMECFRKAATGLDEDLEKINRAHPEFLTVYPQLKSNVPLKDTLEQLSKLEQEATNRASAIAAHIRASESLSANEKLSKNERSLELSESAIKHPEQKNGTQTPLRVEQQQEAEIEEQPSNSIKLGFGK